MWREDVEFLFPLPTQTNAADKSLFIQLLAHVRTRAPHYNYVEVGSYLGGSLVPALRDERCERVLSIDLRPKVQPDARGLAYDYSQVTTEAMLVKLRSCDGLDLKKLRTFEGSAAECDFQAQKFQVAFIDAEHTDEAVFDDFLALFDHLEKHAVCIFHDAPFVLSGLENLRSFLRYHRRECTLLLFDKTAIAVIFLDETLENLPEAIRTSAVNWQAAKKSNRDKMLLRQIQNRCTVTVKLKETPPADGAQFAFPSG